MALVHLLLLLVQPAPDLPQRAAAILKTHCYRCHGQDGTVEGGLNYVLDIKTLVARKKVVPGEPGKSKLFKRVTSDDNPMPPEDEKVRPTKEEIAVLKQWIEAGAPDVAAVQPGRSFLSDADVLQAVLTDLQALAPEKRRTARYFTITHLANAGLSPDELQTYRTGLSKLVNSLSWEPRLVVPLPVDRSRTVYRIQLGDYRWDAAIWQRILELYPYGVASPSPAARAIASLTECDLPYVRADWFVFAAARPPLYHDILQLPRTDRELEQSLRIDVEANIQSGRVARAGFNSSGVSRNNRLIERHPTAFGAYWKSYDFAGNADRQNLFAHPLGPGDSDRQFRQDGGEIIFNLPNGLQAYLLIDGQGNRIDEGPTKIVSVKNRPDPTVINGVSCMFCHSRGMIDKADQVRAHADKNAGAFTDVETEQIRKLYLPDADFRALLRQDAERFAEAAEATGTKLGHTEPVAALSGRFESELDAAVAAAEVGLEPAVFVRALEDFPQLAQRLGSLKVDGGTVQRQAFLEAFSDLAQAFKLGVPLGLLNRELDRLTEQIRARPTDARAYFDRGNVLLDRGNLKQAVADYTDAIALGLARSDVYANRGFAHAIAGRDDAALADLDEAIRLNAGRPETYLRRAVVLVRKGAYARAFSDWQAAYRLSRSPRL